MEFETTLSDLMTLREEIKGFQNKGTHFFYPSDANSENQFYERAPFLCQINAVLFLLCAGKCFS